VVKQIDDATPYGYLEFLICGIPVSVVTFDGSVTQAVDEFLSVWCHGFMAAYLYDFSVDVFPLIFGDVSHGNIGYRTSDKYLRKLSESCHPALLSLECGFLPVLLWQLSDARQIGDRRMAKYCDTKVLERNWFQWLLAESAPELEQYRSEGILWTNLLGSKDAFKCGMRIHCLQADNIILFRTTNLKSEKLYSLGVPGESCSSEYLTKCGFIRESPSKDSWNSLIADVGKICTGISYSFTLREDEYSDLAHDALICVINKITRKKLVYVPGQAPVFNLLTTAIKRICFSQLNKRTKRMRDNSKLLEDAERGIIPSSFRSVNSHIIK
jgi:hypothetical protein